MKVQLWIVAVVLCSVSLMVSALPVSVFVVHCEPTNANPAMWLELVDLVLQADRYSIPLSIYFTPQWAEMISADEDKVAMLETWLASGHEIGCHHHGYWGTKDRGSTWDGYTNTPLEELDVEDRGRFLGTMEDFMEILNVLPGKRRSGCLGGANSSDDIDYPCQLEYSTNGHNLDDVAAAPEAIERNGCQIIEIGHGLIANQERGVLRNLYSTTSERVVFGVVGHVYNYADFPAVFVEWFRFLHELDKEGASRGTVSNILDAWETAP